jgi:hypothetical protein
MKYVVQSRKATPLFLGLLLVMILCLVPAVMAPGPASAQTTVYLPIVFRGWRRQLRRELDCRRPRRRL